MFKFKINDTVKITSGKDKGRQGKVDKVYYKQNKVLISGLNIYKKHVKKNDQMPQGGVVELPRPLLVSRVMLLCPRSVKRWNWNGKPRKPSATTGRQWEPRGR